MIILIIMRPRTIAQQVQAYREQQGLSQRGLARAAEVAAVLVTKLESGAITDPRISTLRKLAEALGVTVAELIGEAKPARKRVRRKR
jgi:XRE family transcriptional regulator, fatty acid utilization regulator